MGERQAPRSRVIGGRREVLILRRAEHDLLALAPGDRATAAAAIESLATHPAPRGARALQGTADGHVQQRVGRLRLLYQVRQEAVVVVAVTGGPV